MEQDRKLSLSEYKSDIEMSASVKKMLDTFSLLNEDNQDILIGEAKKLLKTQRLEDKKDFHQKTIAKAT